MFAQVAITKYYRLGGLETAAFFFFFLIVLEVETSKKKMPASGLINGFFLCPYTVEGVRYLSWSYYI